MDFVADIGTSWLGDYDVARYLIERAHGAGANVIKPQAWPKSVYKGHPLEKEALKCWLDVEDIERLLKLCGEEGVHAQFSVWTPHTVDVLLDIGVRDFKVACSMSDDEELIRHIVESKAEGLAISCESQEKMLLNLQRGFRRLKATGELVDYYYCVPSYPTKFEQLRFPMFGVANHPRQATKFTGFSDHTLDWEAAMIATALGAEVIEKHVMLTAEELRDEFGIEYAHFPDEVCSVDTTVFAVMVRKCLEVASVTRW